MREGVDSFVNIYDERIAAQCTVDLFSGNSKMLILQMQSFVM